MWCSEWDPWRHRRTSTRVSLTRTTSRTACPADRSALYDPQGHELLVMRSEGDPEEDGAEPLVFVCEDEWKNPYLEITRLNPKREWFIETR